MVTAPTDSEAWGYLDEILQRGWAVQADPETRGVTALRNKAKLVANGSTWAWAIYNLHAEVLGMGPSQDSERFGQVSSERPKPKGNIYLHDSLPGIDRVALIGQACESLGLPAAGFTVQLDVSRTLNSHSAIERAVAVFTGAPIRATVIQRGNHWDRCTELVLQWPRDDKLR